MNSPGAPLADGADDGGGAVKGDGVETGVDGADQGPGSGGDGFEPAELKMRVNSPGPAPAPEPGGGAAGVLGLCAAGALGGYAPGAGGFGVGAFPARGAFIDRNMAVKLPGSPLPAPEGAGAGAGGAANGAGSERFSAATAGNAAGV